MRNNQKVHIHVYVDLLYYKQRSLLQVSATYFGHLVNILYSNIDVEPSF